MAILQSGIKEWWDRLIAEGLVPPEVRRVIIDIPVAAPVKVYYECFADKRMFNVDLADGLKANAGLVSVSDAQ